MNHPPEIIAALIRSEVAKFKATTCAMNAENAHRLGGSYSPAYLEASFDKVIDDHQNTVEDLLAQLESPNPNHDTVTISRDAARTCLPELREIRQSFISAEYPHAANIDRAIAELERALEVKS